MPGLEVIDALFDRTDPTAVFTRRDFARLSGATPRTRLLSLLRTTPLPSHRAVFLAALVQHLGTERLASQLGPLAADDRVPVFNRATAAWLLLISDLDPGVAPAQLPVLAESALVGCALLGEIADVQPLLAALLSAPIDREAVIAQVERWRLHAVAPSVLVYGTADERDDAPVDATGRAWTDGSNIDVQVTLGSSPVGPDLTVHATMRLSDGRCTDAVVRPLLEADIAAVLADANDHDLQPVPFEDVVAAGATVTEADGDAATRVTWLLRRLRPAR